VGEQGGVEMATSISPTEIYKYLPRTNCGECGETTCMAFAVKLVNREAFLQQCPPLMRPEFKENFDKLWSMLKPPVREIELRSSARSVKFGGEYVMFRHELTYVNPDPIAIDVTDTMEKEALIERVKRIDELSYYYIGREIRLDLIALRSVSKDPETFKSAVRTIRENTDMPLILCSFDPKVIEAGLEELKGERPLIYGATKDNWAKMGELALKYNCPLVIYSPGDLDNLVSIVSTLRKYGVEDLALDPGTFPGEYMHYTINNFTMLRWKAFKDEEELVGYPLVGSPIACWWMIEGDELTKNWWEALVASSLIVRYADLLIMHGLEGWVLLPLLMLRENIYTDPRKPVSVDPGLRKIGEPDENSPVMMTTNFALTYYTVLSDIESAKIDCFLLVVDTEGLSVESAVAGRKLTADEVASALKESGVENLVKHRKLIIPGRAARLSGEIEDATGWEVLVGPMDSSGIPKFLEEKWKGTAAS